MSTKEPGKKPDYQIGDDKLVGKYPTSGSKVSDVELDRLMRFYLIDEAVFSS